MLIFVKLLFARFFFRFLANAYKNSLFNVINKSDCSCIQWCEGDFYA